MSAKTYYQAEKMIENGKSAEETLQVLKAEYSAISSDEELEKIVYGIAGLPERRKYKWLNFGLIACLLFAAISKIFYIVNTVEAISIALVLSLLAVLLNVYLLWMVFRYRRAGYILVIVFSLLSLPRDYSFLTIVFMGLALILNSLLFPKITFSGKLKKQEV